MRIRNFSIIVCVAALSGAACHRAVVQSEAPAPSLPPLALSGHDTIPTGELRGQLKASMPGYPIGASAVSLDQGRIEMRTDSAGYFAVRGLAPGPHRLEVRRVSFRPVLGTIEMPARGGAAVEIVLEPVTVCLDYCRAEEPRAYGEIRDAQ